jgi:hypothetical protein
MPKMPRSPEEWQTEDTSTHNFVREQSTSTVRQYELRVYRLAAIYFGILITATIAIVLIVVWGKFFITLSQRTNVETLTLAVILLLFGYLAVISAPGAWGACKIVVYNGPRWFGRDSGAIEIRKQKSLKPDRGDPDTAYLNCLVLRRAGEPGETISISLKDAAGSLGAIRIAGAKMSHEGGPRHSSNSLLAFFEQRIQQLVRRRDPAARVQIVRWATIDDERALEYASFVAFAQNVQKQLGGSAGWPSVELTDEDIQTLASEAVALCPALRNEAHLPDVEYEAEHRLPIIPEPLAFISLSRREQRADPAASMGCAFIVTTLILILVSIFILFPPWIPSK